MSEAFPSSYCHRHSALRRVLALSLVTWATVSTAADINVPADQPTIQDGINAAIDGDRVLVSPGTYFERISVTKNIAVVGIEGKSRTVIDGGNNGPVVSLNSKNPRIQGFTIVNGTGSSGSAGGINASSHATIEDNDLEYNSGGAIYTEHGKLRILGNTFRHNNCGGQGVITLLSSNGSTGSRIAGNRFEFNGSAECAAPVIYARNSQPLVVEKNIIRGNHGSQFGIVLIDGGSVLMENNLIHGNRGSAQGGAVVLLVGRTNQSATVVNNTFASNTGSEIYVGASPNGHVAVTNNIFLATDSKTNIYCEKGKRGSVAFSHNLAYSTIGAQNEGDCDVVGDGLLTVDPMFVGGDYAHNLHDFSLASGSPAIDAGDDSAVLEKRDLTGAQRIQGAAVDLGAIEFRVE